MATPFDLNALKDPRLARAAGRFMDFCAESFDWRRNADEPFDETLYGEAQAMVLGELLEMDKAPAKRGGAA